MSDPEQYEWAPSPEWERGYDEAWSIITRHNGGDDQRELATLLSGIMTQDDGVTGRQWVREDDQVWDDAAREILMAGWFRTECCRFCTPSAREHETDEGHTHGESCCLYLPVPAAATGGAS